MSRLGLVLYLMVVCFYGCKVFKQTARVEHSSATQVEAAELLWKQADRERRIYSYWNDSGFYQFEVMRERLGEAKSGRITVKERQEDSAKFVKKEVKGWGIWFNIMFGVIVVIGLIWFIKGLTSRRLKQNHR